MENWPLLAGLGLLIVLPMAGHTAPEAIFWSVLAAAMLSSPRVLDGLERGAINSLIIGVTAGVMGIVLAGVSMPGLGIKFSSIILGYSSFLDNAFGITGTALPVAILLCTVASYIMGMGMTITASYVLLSILAVPALVELGVPLLSAHLMILWLSQDASLTPPFALGAFIAAGVAGADPMRTGFASLKLGKALYIVPFMMAYTPINMTPGSEWFDIIIVWGTGFMWLFLHLRVARGLHAEKAGDLGANRLRPGGRSAVLLRGLDEDYGCAHHGRHDRHPVHGREG